MNKHHADLDREFFDKHSVITKLVREMVFTPEQVESFREDTQRATGRTKRQALRILLEVTENPGSKIFVTDHWATRKANEHLARTCMDVAAALQIREIKIKEANKGFLIWFNTER